MKLTFIWQDSAFIEREWIADVFSSVAVEQITDGDHRIVRDDCLLIDSYLYARSADYYTQFRGKNAWLLHLSDEAYDGGYDIYRNFRGVFRKMAICLTTPSTTDRVCRSTKYTSYCGRVRSR